MRHALQLFLLVDGWVASSITVASGRQQTVKIHLPRDILGTPSLCVTRTAECLTAITPITVRPVSRGDLMGVLARFPRVAAAHFLGAQRERVTLMEALAELSRGNSSNLDPALRLSYQRGEFSSVSVRGHSDGCRPAALVAWIRTVSSCLALHVFDRFRFLPQVARAGRCYS